MSTVSSSRKRRSPPPSASTEPRPSSSARRSGPGATKRLPALSEHAVELVDEEVGARPRDRQRRLHLEDVLVVSGRLHDDAELPHPLAHGVGFLPCRLEGLTVAPQLHPEVQPEAVHGPHKLVALDELEEAALEVIPNGAGVFL